MIVRKLALSWRKLPIQCRNLDSFPADQILAHSDWQQDFCDPAFRAYTQLDSDPTVKLIHLVREKKTKVWIFHY